MIGLRRAALEFDPTRGVPFSSYARYHILRYMRQAIDRGGRWAQRADAGGADPAAPDGAPALDDDERGRLLGAVDALPDNWRRVVRDRYLADPPRLQKEIAADLGITTTRVCQVERKALDRLAATLSPEGNP